MKTIHGRLDNYMNKVTHGRDSSYIYGDNLAKYITLGNIYRPPKCNNNDQVISTFINELAPVITKLGKECSETIIVGDFNIDLLKVGER